MEQDIKRAIAEKNLIEFYYHGFYRVTEPHVLGINGAVKQLLGYQVRGQSSTGGLPEWRRFDLHEIIRLTVLEEAFPGRRSVPSGKHSRWDQQIAIVD